MLERIGNILFPPRCVLCRKVLADNEMDLCHRCRAEAPAFTKSKFKISFVAGWTALWYYKDNVRMSMLRYKFYGARSYAGTYARLLAMRLQDRSAEPFDVLTWVPIGPLRRWRRGYDQVELIARATAKELCLAPVQTLKKIRNTPPQSRISDPAARRANVLGAFRVADPALVAGKRILLLDDVLTTGATLSECARALLTAGAKEVNCATVAVASHQRHNSR